MSMLKLSQCKHGIYFDCLKCGHRHSEDPTKICHKDHTKEMKEWAKKYNDEAGVNKRND